MRVTIIGTGAMASLFAARLSSSADITMLGSWRAQLQAIRAHGLRLVHTDGRETVHAFQALGDIEHADRADLVLVLVKTWQTARAAAQARQLLKAGGMALTLQNGLGNIEILAASVGATRASLGVTSEGALLVAPGQVRHAGAGETHLAYTPETVSLLTKVAEIFREAGFKTGLVNNPDSLLWGKLAINAGINPLTAILQVPTGYLVDTPDARWLMGQAAAETAAVARAQGIELPFKDAAERALEIARATATNRSSMAQDVARGMPTEIDSITGAVVRLGREWQVPTPVNDSLFHLVRTMNDGGDWRMAIDNLDSSLQSKFRALSGHEGDS